MNCVAKHGRLALTKFKFLRLSIFLRLKRQNQSNCIIIYYLVNSTCGSFNEHGKCDKGPVNFMVIISGCVNVS